MKATIRKTRELIERVGWCQNASAIRTPWGSAVGYCMFGALREVALASEIDRVGFFLTALHQEETGRERDFVSFNDDTTTTKEDVVAFLERAEQRALR